MLPMLPMALTKAMAAAFLAGGRGMVLEIHASIKKPDAKPAVGVISRCSEITGRSVEGTHWS